MPVKMISETPLPTPYSVISSPSHMATMVPAVRVRMTVRVSVTVGLGMIAPALVALELVKRAMKP